VGYADLPGWPRRWWWWEVDDADDWARPRQHRRHGEATRWPRHQLRSARATRRRPIGAHVVSLLPPDATLQFGPGGIGEAIANSLTEPVRIGPWYRFMARSTQPAAAPVTAYTWGGELRRPPAGLLDLCSISRTHDLTQVSAIPRFVGCNTALQIGLDGAVNLERVNGKVITSVGGHADFCVAASRSVGGMSIVSVRATNAKGDSTIVPTVEVVSTQRSDIGLVITEHGIADRGVDDAERARRLIAWEHPNTARCSAAQGTIESSSLVRIERPPHRRDRHAGTEPRRSAAEVSRNGICGSDLHTYVGSDTGGAAMHVPGGAGPRVRRHRPRSRWRGRHRPAVGTAVAVAPMEWCGACCQLPPRLAADVPQAGVVRRYREPLHGGLAPFVAVRCSCYVVPAGLGVIEAAPPSRWSSRCTPRRLCPRSAPPCSCAGAGPDRAGRAAGGSAAQATIVSDLSPARAAAATLGATAVVDPVSGDLPPPFAYRSAQGVDIVFDTTAQRGVQPGHRSQQRGTRSSASPAGRSRRGSTWPRDGERDRHPLLDDVRTRDRLPRPRWQCWRGVGSTATMISDHIPLDRAVDDGLEELLHHADQHIKIRLTKDPEGRPRQAIRRSPRERQKVVPPSMLIAAPGEVAGAARAGRR
jgi:threonine dehydrogenase-like Zn-dependent dehydrogenase